MTKLIALLVGFDAANKVIYRHEVRIIDGRKKALRIKRLVSFMKKDPNVVKITRNRIVVFTR